MTTTLTLGLPTFFYLAVFRGVEGKQHEAFTAA